MTKKYIEVDGETYVRMDLVVDLMEMTAKTVMSQRITKTSRNYRGSAESDLLNITGILSDVVGGAKMLDDIF